MDHVIQCGRSCCRRRSSSSCASHRSACFGSATTLDAGPFGDEVDISNALEAKFPDDECAQQRYRDEADAELTALFNKPDVRKAIEALVEALTREGEIDGTKAQAIVEQHLGTTR